MPTIPDSAADLLERPNVAVLTTLEPDGSPQSTAVWVGRDGDDVLVPVRRSLRKTANMRRDPRVSLLIVDREVQSHFLEVRGTVTLTDDPTSSLTDALMQKYQGHPLAPDEFGPERLIARITATRVRAE